jgi:hypothetical protein
MKKKRKMINITDKELDRDIINLGLPERDLVPEKNVDDISYYSDDMKDWLKNMDKLSGMK